MIFNEKSPQYMTSAELEEAIKLHREHTKKLLAESRSRRAQASRTTPTEKMDNPVEQCSADLNSPSGRLRS